MPNFPEKEGVLGEFFLILKQKKAKMVFNHNVYFMSPLYWFPRVTFLVFLVGLLVALEPNGSHEYESSNKLQVVHCPT